MDQSNMPANVGSMEGLGGTKRGSLAYARARVSLLGAGEYMETIDAALDSVEKMRALLRECEATLEMWADVAPAVSLRADIRKVLGTDAPPSAELPGMWESADLIGGATDA